MADTRAAEDGTRDPRAAGTPAGAAGLRELGRRLRARRRELGRSVRAVAAEAGLSASYVSALEAARNPTTGRPAAPSLRVLGALAAALELPAADLLGLAGLPAPGGGGAAAHDHRLVYVRRPRPARELEAIVALYGEAVRRWLYVPDPREPAHPGHDDRVIHCPWPLGSEPYPSPTLEPDRIARALRAALRRAAPAVGAEPAGIVIGDCSAVMRWVANPEDEVGYEARWAGVVTELSTAALGRAAVANVCVYHQDDLEALAPRIDAVGTAMSLLAHHPSVTVLEADEVRSGPDAAAALLGDARPPGVSSHAWRQVATAAARGLRANSMLAPPTVDRTGEEPSWSRSSGGGWPPATSS